MKKSYQEELERQMEEISEILTKAIDTVIEAQDGLERLKQDIEGDFNNKNNK